MYSFKSEVSFLIFKACSFIELIRFEKVSNCSFYLCLSLFISLSRFSFAFRSWYLLRGFVKGLKIELTIWTFEGVCVITFSIFIGWIISLWLLERCFYISWMFRLFWNWGCSDKRISTSWSWKISGGEF